MYTNLTKKESLVERSKRLRDATDVEFTMISHEKKSKPAIGSNEIIFEGKILSPAEKIAMEMNDIYSKVISTAAQDFEKGRMFTK